MANFIYTAMDGRGKERRGKIDAASEQDATAKLKQMGLFVTSLAASREAAQAKAKGLGRSQAAGHRKKGGGLLGKAVIKRKRLTTFTRQLSTLLAAGQALVRGLRTLERQAKKDVGTARVIGEVADAVEGGSTFSEALAGHPKSFNKLYISMVRAGETAGKLEMTLENLAVFMEKGQRIAGKVKSAMAYPAVILTVTLGITIFLMIFLVPKFATIFEDMLPGERMPMLTMMVTNVSFFLRDHFILFAIIVAALVIAFRILRRTKQGSYAIDWFVIRCPPFNSLSIRSTVARFCRTLGTLMDSGVSVLAALQIARETAGNEVVSRSIQKVHDAVKEGEGMTKPMSAQTVFPPIVVSMVEVGEETGALPNMLIRIADVYEEEVDRAVDALTSMMEPLMIVLLAGVVGTIVIAMFLPLIKLMEKLGGG
ncbi:MAG: Type II secretion system protein F [Lentisphaerae bacterium ADurb.BinA184]|nr:MAG: Type II secretion system protein F [Lentisphaerae bacterium ADurb.BinA184]